jgi:5-(carboxyamino)imidazole ribonucleotide mutase
MSRRLDGGSTGVGSTEPAESAGAGFAGAGAGMTVLAAVIMGSRSDWETMEHTAETLRTLEIPHEVRVLSAHRTPDALDEYVADAEARGAQVFVAGAGGAAHLAGVVASKTVRPVLGVPMGTQLGGLDSLLSTVQMPAGIPVGTLAVGRAGAVNAALLAAAILGLADEGVERRLRKFRKEQAQKVLDDPDPSL